MLFEVESSILSGCSYYTLAILTILVKQVQRKNPNLNVMSLWTFCCVSYRIIKRSQRFFEWHSGRNCEWNLWRFSYRSLIAGIADCEKIWRYQYSNWLVGIIGPTQVWIGLTDLPKTRDGGKSENLGWAAAVFWFAKIWAGGCTSPLPPPVPAFLDDII